MEYIIIGITDDVFVRAKTNIKSNNKLIKCLGKLKELTNKLTRSELVRNCLIQANNLASINTIFKSIENKTFNYYEETLQLFKYIDDHINNDIDVLICLSKAGTGKSLLH